MSEHHRFPFENHAKLDDEKRRRLQPSGPLVGLVAAWQPASILDIGVGTGYFALPLAQALPDAQIYGLDVEPRMFPLVAERAKAAGVGGRIEAVEAPPDRVPLEADTVDTALMINLFHELDDRPAYLEEVRRVLSPGGRLLVCDFDPEAPEDFGPPAHHRLAPDVVRAELSQAGFGDAQAHDLYSHLYALSAR